MLQDASSGSVDADRVLLALVVARPLSFRPSLAAPNQPPPPLVQLHVPPPPAMSFRPVSPASPAGEASASFAQTGAEFTLDDSSDAIDDDDDYDDDEEDLRSEVGSGAAESYEMVERVDEAAAAAGSGSGARAMRSARRPSASTVASFQLYTPDEERAVRRKFDRRLVLFVTLLFMLSFLDRSSASPSQSLVSSHLISFSMSSHRLLIAITPSPARDVQAQRAGRQCAIRNDTD